MNLVDLFLSTDGRINRLRFWIGTLILVAISTAATMLNLAVIGVSQTAVMLSVLVAFALAFHPTRSWPSVFRIATSMAPWR